MYEIAIIVFREILEIALVVGIVLAATRGLPARGALVLGGLGLGLLGSYLIFHFTDAINEAVDGVGQEVFNAGVMFTAVLFLSWTVIWMKRHGRELAKHLNEVGAAVVSGKKSLFVIVGVVALATLREGAEIVLFAYGQSLSGVAMAEIISGGLLGLAGGTIVGFMLYFGLLKTVKRHLFSVTSWMLIFLTAGMAAQGANFLIQADMLPMLHPQVWDTSWLLDNGTFLGDTLSVLLGYNPRPTGMELAFYVAVMVIVGGAYKMVGSAYKPAAAPKPQDSSAADVVPAE